MPHLSHSRILLLVDSFNLGGTESQLIQTALHLSRASYDVTVGCLNAQGPLSGTLRAAGIAVVNFPKKKTLLSIHGIWQLMRLSFYLRRHRFDVLHSYDLWANLLGVPAAYLARTPIIISSRRYLADHQWYTPWRNRVLRLLYHLSTHVVVNSGCVRELLIRRDGVRSQKIKIICNGIDIDRLALAMPIERQALGIVAGAKIIAVVANLYPVKGHIHLLAAAEVVCSRHPEAVFILIGDGPERSRLEKEVNARGLAKNILFLGTRLDVPQLLAASNLSVLPSESEALPNALLESMAAGLPVVTTRVGGCSEVIEDGINGLLVPAKDPAALSHAILRVLEHPDWACELGAAAQERVRAQCLFEAVIAQLGRLYNRPPEQALEVTVGDSSANSTSQEALSLVPERHT